MTQAHLEDLGKLFLRIVVGGLMFFHGGDKLLHGPGHVGADLAQYGLPQVLAYGVYVGEVAAPTCVLLGAWTRAWAIVYTLSIAFATLLVHAEDFVRLAPTGGWAAELWTFYITAPLVVALLGPGPFALRQAEFPWD